MESSYIRVRVASVDKKTKEMYVQIKDYDTSKKDVNSVLREVREMFKESAHDIVSLTHKPIDSKEYVPDIYSW